MKQINPKMKGKDKLTLTSVYGKQIMLAYPPRNELMLPHLLKKEELLRKKEEQLRREKEQLRREKEQLRKEEQPIPEFVQLLYKELRESRVKEDFLSLPNAVSLKFPPKIYVRKAYKDLHDIIQSHEKAVLVSGNPGTGKSVFSLYELHCLLQSLVDKKGDGVIVYDSLPQSIFMVLNSERVIECGRRRKPVELCSLDLAATSYYLFDAGTKRSEQPYLVNAQSIVFSSPDKKNYADYEKAHYAELLKVYMPVWSLEELEKLEDTRISTNEIREQFNMWGGIPRYVFASESVLSPGALNAALLQCDVAHLIMYPDCTIDNSTCSHKILQLREEPPHYSSAKVYFASTYIAERYFEVRFHHAQEDAISFLGQVRNNPHLSGAYAQVFEILVPHKLCEGGTFPTKQLEEHSIGEEVPTVVPKLQMQGFDKIGDLAQYNGKDVCLLPKQPNFESIHFVCLFGDEKAGFQVTTTKREHPMKRAGLFRVMTTLKAPKFHVYFVVPKHMYINQEHAFTKKQRIVTQDGKDAIKTLNIVQHVMHLGI